MQPKLQFVMPLPEDTGLPGDAIGAEKIDDRTYAIHLVSVAADGGVLTRRVGVIEHTKGSIKPFPAAP